MRSSDLLALFFVIILVACTTPVSRTGEVPTPFPLTSTPFTATSVTNTPSIPLLEPESTQVPATPSITATVGPPRPTLQMQVKDLRQEGDQVKATVCFEVPNEADWTIDHASLGYKGGETSFESAEMLENQPSQADSAASYRCQEISFAVPVQVDLSNASLTVQGLRATPGEAEFCERYLSDAQPTFICTTGRDQNRVQSIRKWI